MASNTQTLQEMDVQLSGAKSKIIQLESMIRVKESEIKDMSRKLETALMEGAEGVESINVHTGFWTAWFVIHSIIRFPSTFLVFS